jgi:hypothetical protein
MTYLPRVAATIVLFLLADVALAQIDAAQFRRDVEDLSRFPSRSIGTPGYDSGAEYIEKQIAVLPNVELRRHDFRMIVPLTASATIDLGGGRVEKVFPFWPAHVRACTTPPEGLSGNLVYAGNCTYAELRPKSLYRQIAVIEASAGDRWMDAFNMGAQAMIVLGRDDTSWSDLRSHDLRVPVNLPRFYLPPCALADELRAMKHAQATLKASVTWQRKTARNYYALVRAARPAPALMFSVPFESSSLVPDLAPGATQAVQSACGLALLRQLSQHPWDRPVLIAFTGGDSIQMSATRNMLLALAEPPVQWRNEIATLDTKINSTRRDLDRATALAHEPQKLAIPGDRDLIDRTVKVIETDLSLTQDQLFRMRATPASERTALQREQLAAMEARQALLNRLKYAFQQ